MRRGEVSLLVVTLIFAFVSFATSITIQENNNQDFNVTDAQYDEAYGDDEYRAEISRDIDPYDEEDIF